MRFLSIRPASPALAPLVGSLHYHERDVPFTLERILPNGQAHLMINLCEDEFRTYRGADSASISATRGAVLAGPHDRSTVIDTGEQRWLVAVEFKSGGAAAFFDRPISEALNQVVELDQLWGRGGGLLRERLLEAGTPWAKLRILEAALVDHFAWRRDPAISYAVCALEKGMPVADVSSRLGLLPKTLLRRFYSHVGMTPKKFARVRRLQRIVGTVNGSFAGDWSMLAAQHGFTDQAHLIHDFRDLAGITPTEYRPHSSQRRNHVPIASPAR